MTSRATGYFRPGDSWVHRRNPVTKLLALAVVLMADFLLPWPVTLALLGGLALIALSIGLGRDVFRALRVPLALLVSIVVVNALFFPGAADKLATIGPISVSREGLVFGLSSAARLLVAFVASILLLFTTLADDLLESLVARGANHRIAFVVLSAVQMVPRLEARAASILDAQQARGLAVGGSLRERARAVIPLVAPVLLGSLIDVRERTFALEARGFGARPVRTAYRTVSDPPGDRVARWLLIALILVVLGLALTGALGR
ncbi:MAG: energy-coupling factor transporter transmembrane component T family protein [Chloroflexota bacterium]